jgi:inosine-uridine nucleoside N-ribohydrolase
VPLDCTRQVPFTLDLVENLPSDSNRIGAFLRKLFPFYFRAYHQTFGEESILLHKTVALLAAIHPDLFRDARDGRAMWRPVVNSPWEPRSLIAGRYRRGVRTWKSP